MGDLIDFEKTLWWRCICVRRGLNYTWIQWRIMGDLNDLKTLRRRCICERRIWNKWWSCDHTCCYYWPDIDLKRWQITVYLPIMALPWSVILRCVWTRMSGGAIYPRQTQPCGRKLCLDNCGHGNNSNLLSAVPWPDVSCWWVIDVWLLQIYVM